MRRSTLAVVRLLPSSFERAVTGGALGGFQVVAFVIQNQIEDHAFWKFGWFVENNAAVADRCADMCHGNPSLACQGEVTDPRFGVSSGRSRSATFRLAGYGCPKAGSVSQNRIGVYGL